jgi:RimJ/RimL family protein N-acetyltransferase
LGIVFVSAALGRSRLWAFTIPAAPQIGGDVSSRTPVGRNMKIVGLKDGTTVILREPTLDDVERSHRFFLDLPPEDRRYLRVDVTKRDHVERRIQEAVNGGTHRLIALVDDKIVADGALEFYGEGWRSHTGEIRVIVAREYQRRRLGASIIAALYHTAQLRGVEQVVAKLAAPQTGARKILERLGFRVDSVLPEYIKDADGNLQSLVIMSQTLDETSEELKDFYRTDHWPDG